MPPSASPPTSRLSTPSFQDADSPTYLSPRSKVQALLASSDDETDGDVPVLSREQILGLPKPALPGQRASTVGRATKSGNGGSSDEDSEEDVVRPGRANGRLASRLLAQANDEASDHETEDEKAAYHKIKQQLLSRRTGPSEPVPATNVTRTVISPLSGSENGHTKVARRPQQTRRPSSTGTASKGSSPLSRQPSPGLFVSPTRPYTLADRSRGEGQQVESDEDLPTDPANPSNYTAKARLQALVTQKREERQAAEAEAKARAAANRQNAALAHAAESDGSDDGESGRKLTQQARPTRKSSKRAMQEITRETQRMSRGMQLTHEMKVKKKITKEDLFKRFNFRQPDLAEVEHASNATSTSDMIQTTLMSSDVDARKEHETPPSSPPSVSGTAKTHAIAFEETQNGFDADLSRVDAVDSNAEEEMPTLEDVLSSQPACKRDKGKTPLYKLEQANIPQHASTASPMQVHRVRPAVSLNPRARQQATAESDSDLEVTDDHHLALFDQLPLRKNRESRAHLTLKRLAHLTSPKGLRKTAKNMKPSLTPAQLEVQLRQRARMQAQHEKEEKLAQLRARGIVVQTEEEREKDQLILDDMLERARKDAAALRKKEKQTRKEGGEDDVSADESGDEDYVASGSDDETGDKPSEAVVENDDDEDDIDEEIELSGSEEEGVEVENAADNEAAGLLDNEAAEDASDEDASAEHPALDEEAEDGESDREHIAGITAARDIHFIKRKTRNKRVIEDDDDDDAELNINNVGDSQQADTDDLAAAFGFGPAQTTSMGLTQMFAGTMAMSQSQSILPDTQIGEGTQEQDSLELFRTLPSMTLPSMRGNFVEDTQESIVRDSQIPESQHAEAAESQAIQLQFSQPPLQSPAMSRMTQYSPMPEPSQDVGFGLSRSPIGGMQAPHSTIDTVLLLVPESPTVRKKGRLRRRNEIVQMSEDEEQGVEEDRTLNDRRASPVSETAFDIMRRAAAKPPAEAFDKKKSGARDMVEEQAEESEDEYAGLGGASDDEEAGEIDEATKAIIDESDIKVDEREIAAFFANKARVEDEAQMSKLYHDLTSGALRRKRNAAFDLDSDEDEQLAERRRMKQRENARIRRALLADENVGKIAENPKNAAFLRTLEDREADDELDELDAPGDDEEAVAESQGGETQPTARQGIIMPQTAPLAPVSGNALKRKRPEDGTDDFARPEKRPLAHLRRTHIDTFRKPTSLAEVRESVSFLIEEPHSVPDTTISGSDSEPDNAGVRSLTSVVLASEPVTDNPRRTSSSRNSVVDRLLLKRAESSLLTDAAHASMPNLAFHAATSTSSFTAFKVPALLRRATTNMSTNSNSNHSTTTPSSLSRHNSTDSTVRRAGAGGGKKSSIHYAAREAERREKVERVERKRGDEVRRIAALRRGAGLGGLRSVGSGFE
ncbi:hypothetical protein LTR50_005203 [Elasticomyces elasticus]|nr:hypothetical protein LTR50_005203 [Elasticomyces elasticus]